MDDEELSRRFDALMNEVRRQGRAAVAAQAVAEQCLEAIERLDGAAGGEEEARVNGDDAVAGAWVRALLPVADAVDRLASTAQAMVDAPAPGVLARLRADPRADVRAVADGLRVLRAQMLSALQGLGVEEDRPAGQAFDGSRHRAVEVRSGPSERVLEVIRPGYRLGGKVVREAEVVVGKEKQR